ncbi:MAG: tetratricopeptide repeat protein [Planctomycetota bacterium]|jgi:tetratricopeptide (TPR) repeat protein
MRRAAWVLLLGLFALAPPGRSDEIELKSGGRLSCQIVTETETYLEVRLPHGTMRIPRSRIKSIVREEHRDWLEREAGRSLRGGDTRGAVDLYERIHEEHPEDPKAKRALAGALLAHARALRAEHRLDDAISTLVRLARLDPDHPDVEGLFAAIQDQAKEDARLHEQALNALRGQEHGLAIRLLDRWRLRRPVGDELAKTEMAAAYLAAARARLEKGDLRGALDHYRSAAAFGERERTDEALKVLRPIAVLEALKDGETREANRLLDSISTTYPNQAVVLFLRAVMHHVRGEVAEAVDTYARVSRVRESAGAESNLGLSYELVKAYAFSTLRAAIARPPSEGQSKWREIFLGPLQRSDRSEHFTVYAPTRTLAEKAGKTADGIYTETARDLLGGVPPGRRAELVLHPTRHAYVAADPAPPGSPLAGVTLPRGGTGGVCYDTLDEKGKPLTRIELFADARGLFENVLPHELVHLVQRRGLGAFRRGHWLDEGLAMLHESKSGQEARLSRLHELEPMPLAEFFALRSTPPSRADLFYAQAYSITAFLRDLGSEADWRRFLGLFAKKELEEALQEVYRVESIDALERKWHGVL